jgi:hypothetical protein
MIPQENVQFDRAKLKHAVHYICARCPVDELGKVRLHKMLYFADMLHFIGTGTPLTGVQYQKQKLGPIARHLNWAIDELIREGRLRVERRDYFGFEKMDGAPDGGCKPAAEPAVVDRLLSESKVGSRFQALSSVR